ncbi:NACHT domain-containing protein [Granulicella mallensis]|uniref:Putative signal transduction protein with Nacht domain n=1 Tax=Granulicella mallensis (strain ATCC BAA-1857 / DSM 23137 / MP5ACTX8) TaxID=682795 RepID=G8NVW4_GRAMM|nr:NACHT domain-containing protein [Granulicella mallensis]AEU38867.1 putative signal transduction protein with Nacht domain [Granulicella mallensis MP5ACTX8]
MELATIFASAKVLKAIHSFATEESKIVVKEVAGNGAKALFHRLRPTDREKAAKQAVKLFAEEWYRELEDTTPFTSALPGYRDQLTELLAAATPDIAEWMNPETKEVDLGPIERIWSGIKGADLPEDFDWTQVGRNYSRAIRRYFRDDPNLRGAYDTVLHERTSEAAERIAAATERLAGPHRTLDLAVYSKFLIEKKCNTLQLATLHFSTYTVDRKVSLWNVFVLQSARESAPVVGIAPEILRKIREEGHISEPVDEMQASDLLKSYQSSPLRPILEIINNGHIPKRHIVVTGDPGAGKSALIKYLCLTWANSFKGPIPILIDLREYGKKQEGFLKFCESGLTFPSWDTSELDERLKAGEAALYLDGLDEIFTPATRHSVIEEIVTISGQYPQAQIVVTSRKVGYQPERLANAGFAHATLEDFDQSQIKEFLERWHRLAEDDESKRSQLRERLTRAIADSASIRELAGNPLLLTMMAILNRSQELPRNRVSLYRKASEVLLHDWDADRALQSTEKFDRDDKDRLLRDLAGEMQNAKGGLAGNLIERPLLIGRFKESLIQLGITDSHKSAIALVQQLEERNFIIASVGAGRFSFVHRTFLEYFCAAWFVERLGHKEGSQLYLSFDQLRDEVYGQHWKEEKWREVLRLIAGMVHETKAEELIQFLINQDGTNEGLANLMLAAGCLYEVRNRKAIQTTDTKLWNLLVQIAERSNPEDEPLGLFPDDKYDIRSAVMPWIALTWRGEEARKWFEKIAYSGPTVAVQIAAIEAVARGWENSPGTLSWLKDRAFSDDPRAGVSKAIEEVVRGWMDQPDILLWLKTLATQSKSDLARHTALMSLVQHWPKDPDLLSLLLEKAATDEEWFVRSGAIIALGAVAPVTLDLQQFLLHRFEVEVSEFVKNWIVIILGEKWSHQPEITLFLKDRARNDASEVVRKGARRILELTGVEEAEASTNVQVQR